MSESAPFVYFIMAQEAASRIKIGFSRVAERRLRQMAPYSPFKLEVFAKVPGTKRDEYFIHWRFREHHSHHEWYIAAPEILSAALFAHSVGEIPSWLQRDRASESDKLEYREWASLRGHRGPKYEAFVRAQRVSA